MQDEMHSLRSGLALAATAAIFNVICAAAFALAPDATLGFFNAWVHGVDLSVLKPGAKPFDWGAFLYRLVGLVIAAFLIGVVYAAAYNLLGRRSSGRG